MIDANYTLKYNNDDKIPAKLLCLGFCILLDLIVLVGVVACLSTKNYLDLIIYAAIFAIGLAIRIASLFFTFEIIISLEKGRLSIVKRFPIKEIVIINEENCQVKLSKFDERKAERGKKYVGLCSKSCEDNVYVIELSGRNYLIYLDDYLFSLIEVNCDLS